jgi:hypothetical protein
MYFGKVDVLAAVQFLNGFQFAIGAAFGFDRERRLREQVVKARGWRWFAALHPYEEMIRRGMPPERVIDELLVIEIEVLRGQAERAT